MKRNGRDERESFCLNPIRGLDISQGSQAKSPLMSLCVPKGTTDRQGILGRSWRPVKTTRLELVRQTTRGDCRVDVTALHGYPGALPRTPAKLAVVCRRSRGVPRGTLVDFTADTHHKRLFPCPLAWRSGRPSAFEEQVRGRACFEAASGIWSHERRVEHRPDRFTR